MSQMWIIMLQDQGLW